MLEEGVSKCGPKCCSYDLLLANVEQVDGVVVADLVGVGVLEVGRLPGLRDGAVEEGVALVGPDALDEARGVVAVVVEDGVQGLLAADLDLAVLPARDLDDKVDDLLVARVRVQRDVMPEGDGLAVLLEPDAPVLGACQWRGLDGGGRARTRVLGAPTVLRLRAS